MRNKPFHPSNRSGTDPNGRPNTRPSTGGYPTHQRPVKPPLRVQTTTLWSYPSQHYGDQIQGDQRYVGATPSYIIWNLIQRYTKEGDLVVDPFCGSGTTLDVARDTKRASAGFDLKPYRPDITKADARSLPLKSDVAQLVFLDPPYGNHINYSDDPKCIGKLSAYDDAYFVQMNKALRECARVLAPGGHLGLYVSDYYEKQHGFAPVGLGLLSYLANYCEIVDIIAVQRNNKSLERGNFHQAAEEQNFFLRGFNYLFIARKPEPSQPSERGERGERAPGKSR